MSQEQRIEQGNKIELPSGESKKGQRRPEQEKVSTVLEQLNVKEKLLQIRHFVWHIGEVTSLKGPDYGDERITLYDRWIKPSGRSHWDWEHISEHYESFIVYRQPVLSVAASRIGHDKINGDKFLVGVLTNYHHFNNVVNKPEEDRDLPYIPWVWWVIVSEFKLPQAEKKIEEFLLKDCINRQKSLRIPDQSRKMSETEAALTSGIEIPAEFRYLQQLTKEERLECYKRPLGESPVSVDLYIWEEYRKWAESRLLRRFQEYVFVDYSRRSGEEWTEAGYVYVEETRERTNKKPGEVEIVPGESVVKDEIELTITKIERPEEGVFHKGARIKVEVWLKNLSTETKRFSISDFTLQTAEGQIIPSWYDVWDTERALSAVGQLVKGGQVKGNMIFDFPEEEGYQYIIWQDHIFGGDKIYIRV